jgi:hypothetical protein
MAEPTLNTAHIERCALALDHGFSTVDHRRAAAIMRDLAHDRDATEKKLTALRYHAEQILHAHQHGNGLQAWHDLVDKLARAIDQSK